MLCFLSFIAFFGVSAADEFAVGALACTAGTPVQEKLRLALAECGGEEEARTLPLGWRKGGARCPTVEEVDEWFMAKLERPTCVFTALGWLHQETGEFDNATASADIASLPATVAAQLTADRLGECVAAAVAEMTEKKGVKKCLGKYSEEELTTMKSLAEALASYRCFTAMFESACRAQVTRPASRFGFIASRLACLGTCSAANFAATTSCTFGVFFFPAHRRLQCPLPPPCSTCRLILKLKNDQLF